MLRALERRRAGKVSEVFRRSADSQAAYDFLEHRAIAAETVQQVATEAVAKLCAEHDVVYVVLDGSSLTLTEREEGSKGFGSIGSHSNGARGIKVLNALALGPEGQTLGVIAQRFWVRTKPAKEGPRPLVERESCRWHEALQSARTRLSDCAPETKRHVLADREGDASLLMQRIVDDGDDFTIRANGHRNVVIDGQKVNVRDLLSQKVPIARTTIPVPAKGGQPSRIAALAVRAARVQIVLRDHHTKKRRILELTVVWGREEATSPGAKRLDWMLYTTVPVKAAGDAVATLVRYSYRWRIEEYHRLLKRGGGRVEDTQLRSPQAVIKWATMHSIVAGRAQRLRDASRSAPDLPASTELTADEIEALVFLKQDEKRRNEIVSAEGLTLQRAVRWIADLGGFTATGKSTKPPGSTVIARGLERVLDAQQLIHFLRAAGKLR